MTHAFSLVVSTQGQNLYPDTRSQWISHKTLLERTKLKLLKKIHKIAVQAGIYGFKSKIF